QAKEGIRRQRRGNIFEITPLKGDTHEMPHLVALRITMVVDVTPSSVDIGGDETALVLRELSQRAGGDIPGVDLRSPRAGAGDDPARLVRGGHLRPQDRRSAKALFPGGILIEA